MNTELDRCETLVKFCKAAAWSNSTRSVYQSIVDNGANILNCDGTHLHLLTVDGSRFVCHACHSDTQAKIDKWKGVVPASLGRLQWMMRSHLPILMDYENPHVADRTPPEALDFGYKSAVSIPILVDDDLLGMFSSMYKRELPWSESDQDYLLKIGSVLGVMIQRVQRAEKDLELQILNERKRLSAELHDNLAQLISAFSLSADTALMSYEDGDSELVHADLEHLSDVSKVIMKMLRQEMLSLRIPLESTDELVEGVRNSLVQFEHRWGIETKFMLDAPEPTIVSAQTALQLTRILNECLSNTLKHAQATCVTVILTEDNGTLTFIVCDDGRGFNVAAVSPEHLGIRIMRERAMAAGGEFAIASDDRGTVVSVSIARPT